MHQRMPGTESSSIRTLAVIGNGVTASLLEGAGINILADAWALDLTSQHDDDIIQRLIRSAEHLQRERGEEFGGCHWDNILTRAYNRLILLNEVERFDIDVPIQYRCSISFQWPDQVVLDPNGRIYDRVWIERWIRAAGTNPFTREPLTIEDLREDLQLQTEIETQRSHFALGFH